MANEFVAQLPEARAVSGSAPLEDSTAAAIGETLKGAAALLDVGLKHSAERREKKVLSSVEDSLAEQSRAFTTQNESKLVGEEGSVANPEDIGFSGDQWSRMDRLRQGNAQGRISRAEFYAKTSSIVQQAIHDNPRFADSIRRRAQAVLGIAPTAAAVALEAEGQKAAEDIQRNAKAKLLEQGLARGIGDMNPDGTFDIDSSILKTQRALATDAYLDSYNKTLEANIKYKQLMGGDKKELSLAERKDIEVRSFMGGETSTGYQGSDIAFHDSIDSFFSTIPAALEKNKNLAVPDQEAMIMNEIGQRRLVFMGWLNSKLNQVTMSPDSKEAIRKNYMDQFAQYEDWAKGGFSNLQRNAQLVKQLETRAGKNGWSIARASQEARVIYGDQVWASVASTQLATEAGTATRDTLDRDSLKIGEYLQHGAAVASGQAKTTELAPKDQPGGMRAVTAAVDSTSKLINSGQSLDPDKDIVTFGNSMVDVLDSAARAQNVDNIRGSTKWSASPSVIQTLGTLNKSNPEQARQIGQGMMLVNRKAITLTGQSIIKDVEAANAAEKFRASQMSKAQNQPGPDQGISGRPAVSWEVIYDADEGAVKAVPKGQDTNMLTALPPIPPNISTKIRDMNNALRANAILADEYGSDREKGMDGSSLKLAYIKASGMPVVGGETEEGDSEVEVEVKDDSRPTTGTNLPKAPKGVTLGELNPYDEKTFPLVKNQDGSSSSIVTEIYTDESGTAYLLPSMMGGKKIDAWQRFQETGQYFAKSKSIQDLEQWDEKVHEKWNKKEPLKVNKDKMISELIRDESGGKDNVRLKPYKDAWGQSIGHGHFIQKGEEHLLKGITREQAEALLSKDMEDAYNDIKDEPYFKAADTDARERALVNMRFNLGAENFREFKQTLRLIEQKKWHEAGENLKKTLWYKQTGDRAKRVIRMLQTGE